MDIRYVYEAAQVIRSFTLNNEIIIDELKALSRLAGNNNSSISDVRVIAQILKSKFVNIMGKSKLSDESSTVLSNHPQGSDFLNLIEDLDGFVA